MYTVTSILQIAFHPSSYYCSLCPSLEVLVLDSSYSYILNRRTISILFRKGASETECAASGEKGKHGAMREKRETLPASQINLATYGVTDVATRWPSQFTGFPLPPFLLGTTKLVLQSKRVLFFGLFDFVMSHSFPSFISFCTTYE